MIKSTKELLHKNNEYILFQQIEIQLAILKELKKLNNKKKEAK